MGGPGSGRKKENFRGGLAVLVNKPIALSEGERSYLKRQSYLSKKSGTSQFKARQAKLSRLRNK